MPAGSGRRLPGPGGPAKVGAHDGKPGSWRVRRKRHRDKIHRLFRRKCERIWEVGGKTKTFYGKIWGV
eukprot:1897102-Pyramimonas_sp.AAC.1